MMNNKIKMELTEVDNGFILGIINPDFQPGAHKNSYYKNTFVSNDLAEVSQLLVAHLVTQRMQHE